MAQYGQIIDSQNGPDGPADDPTTLVVGSWQHEQKHKPTLEAAINAWIDSKRGLSNSASTESAYRLVIESFREALHDTGIDLDGEVDTMAAVAQVWSRRIFDGRRDQSKPASASTINQRLAVLSSFYRFAKRRNLLGGKNPQCENPITLLERAKVQEYAHAQALPKDEVSARLKAIDQRTDRGKRDYALILVALATGRRRAELAALSRGDLTIQGDKILVTWRHCKGGKVMHDTLTGETAAALRRYLAIVPSGSTLPALPTTAQTPVWLSLSRANPGEGIGLQTIRDIYAQRLGTSKVHTTRHTFAVAMEANGAKVSEIQAKLGHSSLAVTGRYLTALTSSENPYSAALESFYGIG